MTIGTAAFPGGKAIRSYPIRPPFHIKDTCLVNGAHPNALGSGGIEGADRASNDADVCTIPPNIP